MIEVTNSALCLADRSGIARRDLDIQKCPTYHGVLLRIICVLWKEDEDCKHMLFIEQLH